MNEVEIVGHTALGSDVELFEDEGGAWRWRVRSSNGQNVYGSGESFSTKSNARRAAKLLVTE